MTNIVKKMDDKGELFMKTKKLFSLFVIAIVAILMLMVMMSTVQAVDATSKVKVTWNVNGGKISSDKIVTTSVTKGAKVGKLSKTPKKAGYVFKGWYTKKSGGVKITTATKVKKKVTYYAHWKKVSGNNGLLIDSKIVGKWKYSSLMPPSYRLYLYNYEFYKNGSFKFIQNGGTSLGSYGYVLTGKYSTSKGNIYLTNLYYAYVGEEKTKLKDEQCKYSFGKDTQGEFLAIPRLYLFPETKTIENPVRFRPNS